MKLIQRLLGFFRGAPGPMVVSQRRRDAITGAIETFTCLAVPIGHSDRYLVTLKASGRAESRENWSRARLMGLRAAPLPPGARRF